MSDGQTYKTWKPDIGNKAFSLMNSEVIARVNVKPSTRNPQYMDYYLDDIAPASVGLPPMAMPAQPGTPVQQAPPAGPPMQGAPVQQQAPIRQGRYSPEEETRMARAGALKNAVNLAAGLFAGVGPEGMSEADAYIRAKTLEYEAYVQTGSWQPPVSVGDGTPAAIATGVNAAAPVGAAVVQTGSEIPWDQNQQQA